MKPADYLAGGIIPGVNLILVLFFPVLDLESRVRDFGEPNEREFPVLAEPYE
jgi:hypothetical protein